MTLLQERSAPSGAQYPTGRWRGRRQIFVALTVVAAIVAPFFLSRVHTSVLTQMMLTAMGAIALTVLTGVAGKVSFGNAAFMAIGGVTAATLSTEFGAPFIACVAGAGLAGGALGLVAGLPASRLSGLYLAIASLALHFIVMYAFELYQTKSIGFSGWTMPAVQLPLGNRPAVAWYLTALMALLLCVWLFSALLKSAVGRGWAALKEHESMLASSGVRPSRATLQVFALTSAVISVQGAILAFIVGSVTYESFTLHLALTYLVVIFVGGVGRISGALVGAIFVVGAPYVMREVGAVLPEGLGVTSWYLANIFALEKSLFGVAVLAVLLLRPAGLVSVFRRDQSSRARSERAEGTS